MDVISILSKKRQEVSSFEVKVHADRAEEHPKVFTHLTIEYVISGKDISKEAVERAVQLSADKYCPAPGHVQANRAYGPEDHNQLINTLIQGRPQLHPD